MPGDINTYSLGIEFNLSASTAIQDLDAITQKVTDINSALSEGFKVNIDNAPLQANIAVSEAAVDVHEDLTRGVEIWAQTLADLQSAMAESVQTESELVAFRQRHAATIKEAIAGYADLREMVGANTAEAKTFAGSLQNLKGTEDAVAQGARQSKKDAESLYGTMGKFLGLSDKAVAFGASILDSFGAIPDSLKEAIPGLTGYEEVLGKGTKAGKGIAKSLGGMPDSAKSATKSFNLLGESVPKGMVKEMDAAKGAVNAFGGAAGAPAATAESLGAAGSAASSAGAAAAASAGPLAIAVVAYEVLQKAVAGVADAMGALGMSSSDSGKAFMEAVKTMSPLGAILVFVKHAIIDMVEAQDEFRTTTYRVLGTIDETVGKMQTLRAELSLTRGEAVEVIKSMVETGAALVATGKDFEELSETVAKFKVATGVASDTTADFSRVIVAHTGDVGAAERTLGMVTAAMKKYGISAKEVDAVMGKMIEKGPGLRALFDPNVVEQYTGALLGLSAAFKKLGGGAGQASELMQALESDFTDAALITGVGGAGITNYYDRLEQMTGAILDQTSGWNDYDIMSKEVMAGIYGLSAASVDLLHKMKEQGKSAADIRKEFEKLADEAKANEEVNQSFQESIATIKQEMMRILEPILAVISKGMKPLGKVITAVMNVVKPFIDMITWVIDVLDELGIMEALVWGAGLLLFAVFEVIAGTVIMLMSPLVGLVAALVAVGAAMMVAYKIAKIVFTPIIWGAKVVWELLKAVWSVISDVASAIKEGIGEAWEATIAPITEAFKEIQQAFDDLKKALGMSAEESKGWGETLKSIAKGVAKVFKIVFWPIKIAAKIIAIALKPIVVAIQAIGKIVKWVKGILFGSSFLHLKEGIAAIKTPLNFVISIFEKIWGVIKKVASIITSPFKAIGSVVKGVVKMVGGIITAPFKAVGAAVKGVAKTVGGVFKAPFKAVASAGSWLKKKLFGSGFLGLDTGISALLPYFTKMESPWARIGKAAMKQLPIIGGFFGSVFDPMKKVDKMMSERGRRAVDPKQVMTMQEKVEYMLTGRVPERARTVAATINQEMGRESKGEKEMRELRERMSRLVAPLELIAEMIEANVDVKKIIGILEENLPKMTERPSELGPSVAMW
jgi:phage-related protein